MFFFNGGSSPSYRKVVTPSHGWEIQLSIRVGGFLVRIHLPHFRRRRKMGKCWDCTSPSELQGSTGPLGVTVNLNVIKSGWWFQPL